MPTRSEAEENLRVIRSLMERATIYRAISAPTALVGGLCATAFGLWLYLRWRAAPAAQFFPEFERMFIPGWLMVLMITTLANALFIWQAARRRGEPFLSPAMRKALFALLPPMLCGGFFTVRLYDSYMALRWLVPLWMMFYGLGLLATAQFAPKSIPILGWFFLGASMFSFLPGSWVGEMLPPGGVKWFLARNPENLPLIASVEMVATFGLFHLIYAACTWPRRSAVADPVTAP